MQQGDLVKVTFRGGWTLVTRNLEVPEPPDVAPLGDAARAREHYRALVLAAALIADRSRPLDRRRRTAVRRFRSAAVFRRGT